MSLVDRLGEGWGGLGRFFSRMQLQAFRQLHLCRVLACEEEYMYRVYSHSRRRCKYIVLWRCLGSLREANLRATVDVGTVLYLLTFLESTSRVKIEVHPLSEWSSSTSSRRQAAPVSYPLLYLLIASLS